MRPPPPLPATDPSAGAAVTTEARPGGGGAVGASIMDGDDLDVLVVAAAVDLLVFDPQVGEMDLLVEVREVVFERPFLDLPRVAIRVAVVVVAVPIALVQPLLVLALELVVQDDAFDVRVALVQALRDAQIRLVDLGVVFELALAFEARVELLARRPGRGLDGLPTGPGRGR